MSKKHKWKGKGKLPKQWRTDAEISSRWWTIEEEVVKQTDTIQERFLEFHEEHPEVYRRLVELSHTAHDSGRDRWAIGNLWEILRWEYYIEGVHDSKDEFKLNDHYRSRYARLIMKNEVPLETFFEIRKLRTP